MKSKFINIPIILLIFSIIAVNSAFCASIKISSEDDLGNVMMSYFMKKDTSQLPMIVRYVSTHEMFKGSSRAPLMGFFAGIKRDNPTYFIQLAKMPVSQNTNKMFQASNEFNIVIEDMFKRKYYSLESPAALDTFWGYFFATGDERAIAKLCYTSEHAKSSVVRGAAKWSLDSNRNQYPNKIKACSEY